MTVASQFEDAFLPPLREAERLLAREYPQFKFNSGSSSVGARTEYQGHTAWLECMFPDAADDEADTLAIGVGLRHLTTQPQLCEASVGWGNGRHPQISLELLERPIEFSEHELSRVAGRLPELIAAFRRALEAWRSRGADV